MIRRLWPIAATTLLTALAAACNGDAALSPDALATRDRANPAYIDGLLNRRGGGPGTAATSGVQVSAGIDTVLVLKRSFYLNSDVSVTKVIGPGGGDIRVDGVGARIVFPAGAVTQPTTITMTAKRGWNVAYEFAPHGITFAVPASIEQDLRYTLAGKTVKDSDLQAGYYSNLDEIFLDPWKLFARVTEVRRVRKVEPKNPHLVRFDVVHFSGYLMSSGFKGWNFGGGDAFGDDGYGR